MCLNEDSSMFIERERERWRDRDLCTHRERQRERVTIQVCRGRKPDSGKIFFLLVRELLRVYVHLNSSSLLYQSESAVLLLLHSLLLIGLMILQVNKRSFSFSWALYLSLIYLSLSIFDLSISNLSGQPRCVELF